MPPEPSPGTPVSTPDAAATPAPTRTRAVPEAGGRRPAPPGLPRSRRPGARRRDLRAVRRGPGGDPDAAGGCARRRGAAAGRGGGRPAGDLPPPAARPLPCRLGHGDRLRYHHGRDERPLLPVGRPHPAGPRGHPGGAGSARPLRPRVPPRGQPRLGRTRPRRCLPPRRRRLRKPRPHRCRLCPGRRRHVGGLHHLQRPHGPTLPAGRRAGPRHGGGRRTVPPPGHRRSGRASSSTR